MSGFGTYNGGVRFFQTFADHINQGGQVVSFFAGSTAQRLTSRQLVEELLKVGAEVNIVNRKRLLHAKCYGSSTNQGDQLIVTSGNFTGPGLSQNVEAALLIDDVATREMHFSWTSLVNSLRNQNWDRHVLTLANMNAPGWQLLYDEYARNIILDETEEVTLVVTLSHSDTARIQATAGTNAGLGSQYFWLSKDSYGFFPPLTIRNQRGIKATFSCDIRLHYMDKKETHGARVTFEAENNLDFRLGTGPLRGTRTASQGDLAAISRTGEKEYELRLYKPGNPTFAQLLPYAVNHVGHQGKRYGYIDNDQFTRLTGVGLPSAPKGGF